MPLEVRQIGISMQVAQPGGGGDADDEEGGDPALDLLKHDDGARDGARLIQQCVDAVLAELARRSER